MNTKQAEVRVKPLSDNPFLAFFQKIWRWWLGVWYGFAEEHPKAASLLYKVFFFIVFSEGVTIVQILLLIFLPQLFGLELAATEFMWPKVYMGFELNGEPVYWSLFGNMVMTNEAGEAIIGGGLGYFLAFKIATFIAQVINFPLQRNITYKSKGNPYWQAMWYFIGWVGINAVCDGINNLWLPFANAFFPPSIMWLKDILAMIAQGGVAMVIFFFIFMVIFPDLKKGSENARKKADELKAKGADADVIAAAELKALKAEEDYRLDEARKNVIATSSTADAKAVAWSALSAKLDKMKNGNASAEEIAIIEQGVADKYQQALEAAQKREEAIAENEATIVEVAAAREARA